MTVLLSAAEDGFFHTIVHGLRSRGWSRIKAEGEALERIERARQDRRASNNEVSGDK